MMRDPSRTTKPISRDLDQIVLANLSMPSSSTGTRGKRSSPLARWGARAYGLPPLNVPTCAIPALEYRRLPLAGRCGRTDCPATMTTPPRTHR